MQYADFDFYVNVYKGNAIRPEDFPRLCQRASEYVNGMTFGRCEKVPQEQRDMVQKAVCAVAEVIQNEERMISRGFSGEKTVASESVGRHSVTYTSPSVSSAEAAYLEEQKREKLLVYLRGVPALRNMFGARSFPCTHRIR